ncbi:hypothetical protein [Infirmifilum sp. NZ]|uniref:hypothetical protein n=1 Tax=Infirmifilum sp. NZ TaxID=2926850 RepID=UPI0027A827F0|nr:hypothetical protein [Infirmifilum sp. NZ]UNQ73100.1 hypothetical protein MOV14_08300 [Infirmifilum sp. NZ]
MLVEVFCLLGLAFVLWGLFSRRTTFSLLSLSAGSIMVAFAISELAGWVPAMLVASLYAGALVALMTVWVIVVAGEKARIDTIYTLALVFMFLIVLAALLLISSNQASLAGRAVLREADYRDFSLLTILLLVALLGGVHTVRGGGE